MGSDPEVGARPAGAEQDETSPAVLGIVLRRVVLIYLATVLEASRTGEAVSLMTQGGQNDAGFESCVPDVLVTAYLDGARLAVV